MIVVDGFEMDGRAVVLRDEQGNLRGYCSLKVARYLRDHPLPPPPERSVLGVLLPEPIASMLEQVAIRQEGP